MMSLIDCQKAVVYYIFCFCFFLKKIYVSNTPACPYIFIQAVSGHEPLNLMPRDQRFDSAYNYT